MHGKCLTRENQTILIFWVSPESHCLFSPSLLTFPLTAHACKTYMQEKIWAVLQSTTMARQEHYFTYDLKCCLRFLCRFLLELKLNSKTFVYSLATRLQFHKKQSNTGHLILCDTVYLPCLIVTITINIVHTTHVATIAEEQKLMTIKV